MKKSLLILVIMLFMISSFNIIIAAEDIEEEPLVSTVFYEEDIREALNEIAMQTGVNIIYDETVHGTVTLDLQDVPLEKALEMMLITGGYTYQKMDDYYLIGMPDPDTPTFQHLTETETIELQYLNASQAQDLLPNYYSQFIESSPDRDNIITLTAPEEIIEQFKNDLKKIDHPETQILIKLVVTEISTEVLEERGSEFVQLFTGSGPDELDFYDYLDDESDDYFMGLIDSTVTLAAGSTHGKLLTVLNNLEREEKAEVRANPRVRVTDRETAELFVGEERTLILEPEDEDATIETVDVGFSLEITPEVLNDDELRLEVTPDISHFTHEAREQLVVRRSEIDTTVYAKEGETLNLAGMNLDEVVQYEDHVPFLSDIPLVRWLFRSKTEETGERELMVFITPEIVEGGADDQD